MPGLVAIAEKHGIAVVEYAAEALLSTGYGRSLGTHGVMGCFSFSPNKTITTGQGGMVVTDDDALEVRLRQLKDQGRPVRGTGGDDEHPAVGFNFKLTNLQAAVGLAQLDRIDARVERMRNIYRQYEAGLAGVDGITLPGFDLDAGEIHVTSWTGDWTGTLRRRTARADSEQSTAESACPKNGLSKVAGVFEQRRFRADAGGMRLIE